MRGSRCSACRSASSRAPASPSRASTAPPALLAPSFQQSDLYGFGFKLPYYRVLGPSADATITPFLTTTGGLLMEGEYRRRFSNGGFDLWGVSGADRRAQRRHGRRRRARRLRRGRQLRSSRRLQARLRPEPRHRRDLPHPVRLYRRRPAHQHRPRAADPRRATSSRWAPSPSRAWSRARTARTCPSSSPSSPIAG